MTDPRSEFEEDRKRREGEFEEDRKRRAEKWEPFGCLWWFQVAAVISGIGWLLYSCGDSFF
jgi:hypothetical protein